MAFGAVFPGVRRPADLQGSFSSWLGECRHSLRFSSLGYARPRCVLSVADLSFRWHWCSSLEHDLLRVLPIGGFSARLVRQFDHLSCLRFIFSRVPPVFDSEVVFGRVSLSGLQAWI